MLITEVKIKFMAGNGGNGKVSFYKVQRGPDGGNGANGGNINIGATTDIYALKNLAKLKKVTAENGEHGKGNKKDGKAGQDTLINLPLGSIITDINSREIFTINKISDRVLICRGGRGGKGNWEYRSSTNTTPLYAQSGIKGQVRELYINLKLIADYGFIGFPNAGKSSLLKELSSANPKIANYPFTTLEPNLGECNGKIMADIPGLIEGASRGKGLGFKFLKHIEKVSLIFHCISCELLDPKKAYQIIAKELEIYNPELLKKPEIILLTKSDLVSPKELNIKLKALKGLGKQVMAASIHDYDSINRVKNSIK